MSEKIGVKSEEGSNERQIDRTIKVDSIVLCSSIERSVLSFLQHLVVITKENIKILFIFIWEPTVGFSRSH